MTQEAKKIIYPGNNQKIKLEFKYFSRVEGKIKFQKMLRLITLLFNFLRILPILNLDILPLLE